MNRILPCLLLAPLLATGCNVNNIRVKDSTSFNHFEASLAIPDSDQIRIRLRASEANGKSHQSVADGDLIRIEDTPFFGPLEFESEAELSYFSIAIGRDDVHADFIPGKVKIITYLGLSQTNFDLSLQNQGSSYFAADTTTEFYLQYGFVSAINSWFSAGLTYALSFNADSALSREIDLLMELKLSREIRLSGGYRWYEYTYDTYETNDSTIELDFSGPFLGINIPI